MHTVMGALHNCRVVKFDSCNNLILSVHTILVVVLQYVRLNTKELKYYIILFTYFLTQRQQLLMHNLICPRVDYLEGALYKTTVIRGLLL